MWTTPRPSTQEYTAAAAAQTRKAWQASARPVARPGKKTLPKRPAYCPVVELVVELVLPLDVELEVLPMTTEFTFPVVTASGPRARTVCWYAVSTSPSWSAFSA
jgi:hypothetical protein